MKIPLTSSRIESIDLLRGVVIVMMALDHVRDYFHAEAFLFDPTDLSRTTVPIFFTRWVTHFCAPAFVFLAGTSAWLTGIRKGPIALSAFLIKRGLWLILLELTIVNFGWFFNVKFSFLALIVIWVLGVSMIALAALVRLPFRAILIFSIILIVGHDALDDIHFNDTGWAKVVWGLLHDQTYLAIGEHRSIFIGYAMIPWIGVMGLGYCFGKLYDPSFDAGNRKRSLLQLGVAGIIAFILLRATNLYGDPRPWYFQNTIEMTVCAFLNCTKYPPSLLYLLMTLSPAMVFLALTEQARSRVSAAFLVIGRVPLFFYVVHIYAIHLVATLAVAITGFSASSMVFNQWITTSQALKGYGFNLGVVYLVWALLIAALYPLCRWFDAYKRAHRDKAWLSYC